MLNESVVKQLDKKLFTEYKNNKEFFDKHEFYYTDKTAEPADLFEYSKIKYELVYPFEIEYVYESMLHIERALYKMVLSGYFKQSFLNSIADGFLFTYKELDSNFGVKLSQSGPIMFKFNVFPLKKIS